jgi:undecaprenyl-diphosphatase
METIENIDQHLFLLINGLHNEFLDSIMWWASNKFIWIPLYAWLAWMLYRKFGREGLYLILFSALLITLSDQGSVLIKNQVMRLRPCHNEVLAFVVHTVNDKCGGQYGFVSSHAANVMALFTYLLILTRNRMKYLTYILAGYVIIVSYSRIYMGVHFPLDVAGGWIVGIIAALITLTAYVLTLGIPSEKDSL